MRILPVVDLLAGRVVRAVRGDRSHYQPLAASTISEPTPTCVARFLAVERGFRECYVADLDAIQGRAANESAWRELASHGLSLCLDAGLSTAGEGVALMGRLDGFAPESRVIAGLETMRAPAELRQLVERIGPERVVFSLDLRAGKPLTSNVMWGQRDAKAIATTAIGAGCTTLILLDLASVGSGEGLATLPLLAELRRSHPGVALWVGGGIRDGADIALAAEAGATGCLIGSAIYDGRVTELDRKSLATEKK